MTKKTATNSDKFLGTPAPWQFSDAPHKPWHTICAADGQMVASPHWPYRMLARLDGDCEPGAIPDTEVEANAHLIATAPELLEALKYTFRYLDELGVRAEPGHPLNDARAVIAKALGR